MSESKTYDVAALQRLYKRLHQHYVPVEESHFTLELVDPEAFYRELATFALWIMTEPTSERTQALANECDQTLTTIHNEIIRGLSCGQTVEGCICMAQYIEQKCDVFRAQLAASATTDEERTKAQDALEKWTDRLSRLR